MAQQKRADSADIKAGRNQITPEAMLVERGATGLNEWGGFLGEEFLVKLQGARGYEKYREMRLNNAMVGAVLFAIEQVLLSAEWSVLPGEGPDGEAATRFIEQNLADMEYTWRDTLSESLSFLPYGYSLMEIVLKQRKGRDPGIGADGWPLPASDYDDGRLGWAKFAIRGQETVDHWQFGPHGDTYGVWQRDPKTGDEIFIPRSRLIHLRTTSTQGNPEGTSILRTSYRSYLFATRIEEIEAIGIERDATGLPVLTPPEGIDLWQANNTQMTNQLAYAKKVVTGIRRDAHAGVVKPNGWVLELLSAPGSNVIDTGKVIDRYNWAIARAMLAMYLEQARQGTGSYAGKISDVQMFLTACRSWHKRMEEEFQERAVNPLVTVYNSFRLTKTPQLRVANVTEKDIEIVAESIERLAKVGFLTPDRDGEQALRPRLSLPPLKPESEYAPRPSEEEASTEIAGDKPQAAAAKAEQTRATPHDILDGGGE